MFNRLSPAQGRQLRCQQKSLVDSIANSSDFVDICALFGYRAEEHIVETGDGYLLGLHRLSLRKGENDAVRASTAPSSARKPVSYLHHGLLMNSEVWVCIADVERCLPFTLVEKGYDVWVIYLADLLGYDWLTSVAW